MDEYSNSHKTKETKEEAKKVSSVVSKAPVKTRSVSAKKIARAFLAEDIDSVTDYIINDVLIPNIKDAVVSTIKNGAEMLFYGKAKPRSGSTSLVTPTRIVNYNKQYAESKKESVRPSNGRGLIDPSDYGWDDRIDADNVLEQLVDLIEVYHAATMADFCQSAGIPDEYTDRNYGWTSLGDAEVVFRNGKWYLNLPKAVPLKK